MLRNLQYGLDFLKYSGPGLKTDFFSFLEDRCKSVHIDDGSCNSGDVEDENFLSDVIEIISTDPEFKQRIVPKNSEMYNGGGEIPVPAVAKSTLQARKQAYVKIVEQPASKALRFRYECEGRSAGSIPGARSTSENKTYPTIQIVGYQGKAVVVVSCVTKDKPHRPHPHNLVGREGCKKGVCTLEIPADTMTVQFSNLGIQCVKKKDIEHALRVREEIRVDPFRTGFSHRNQPTSIDLNTVRLCFQVFLEGDTPKKFSVPLVPVVSEPIYDKKAMSDLSITKLSDCVSYVDGGRKDMILLCEKVAKEDIKVRFFEDPGDWEAFAEVQPSQVHKQHAIWFRTPRYKTLDVTEPVKVFIQLTRPSDGAFSDPLPFELWPLESEPTKRKRPKIENPQQIIRTLQGAGIAGSSSFAQLPAFTMSQIKLEPRGAPSPFGGSVSSYGDVSPMYNITSPPSQPAWDNTPLFPTNVMEETLPNFLPNIPFDMNVTNSQTQQLVTNLLDHPNTDFYNLDSGEIEKLTNNLRGMTQTLPNLDGMSLSDVGEMSDSLTNLTNRAAEAYGIPDVNKLGQMS